MSNRDLTVITQNSKAALLKSKNLLDITKKLIGDKSLVQSFRFIPFIREKGHNSSVYSVAISSDGKYIVSGSWDNTIKIWDREW